jgi:drug/metabolite transporter (DMT)-like permease
VGDDRRAPRLLVVAAFAAIYLVWGSTYLGIRYAIETLPPLLMAGTRFVLAGAILYAWVRLRGTPAPRAGHWPAAFTLGGLLLLGGNGAVSWAEQRVASGAAALIVATIPIWVALFEGLRPGGPRPGRRGAIGLLLGLGGVALLAGPGAAGSAERVDPLGAAVLMFAALSWTAGTLRAPRAHLPASKPMAIAMEMLAGGVLLIAAGLALGEGGRVDPAGVSLRSALALLYLVVFGSIVAFSAFIWLLGVCSAARVSTYAFVNPVVAVLLGWGLAGEPLGPRTLLASAVIVAAVALIVTRRASSPRPPLTAADRAAPALPAAPAGARAGAAAPPRSAPGSAGAAPIEPALSEEGV